MDNEAMFAELVQISHFYQWKEQKIIISILKCNPYNMQRYSNQFNKDLELFPKGILNLVARLGGVLKDLIERF